MIIFSGDPTENAFNTFLKNYGIWIAVGVAGVVFITVLILFFVALRKRKNEPVVLPTNSTADVSTIFAALGGEENIISHSLNGSRIILVLKDYKCVNEPLLNNAGIDSVIKMSNKITLVVKRDAVNLYKKMFRSSEL